jgi:ABC-2 type transport system ATP-binding protein
MPQRFSLYGDLTVAENLEFVAGIYRLPARARRQAVADTLARVGLTARRATLADHLSGGQRQRLALAGALVHGPAVLFLDEPTAGADPLARQQMWDLLYQAAAEGRTILVTTHYIEEAERCQTLAFLHGGRLLGTGAPEACRAALEETVLEVDAVPVGPAAAAARGVPGVTGVSIYGHTLRVFSPAADRAPALAAALAAAGVAVRGLRPVPPTLEDVFLVRTRTAPAEG